MGKDIEVEKVYENKVVIRIGAVHITFRREMWDGIERITSSSRFIDSQRRKSTYVRSGSDFREACKKAREILHHNGAPAKRKKVKIPRRQNHPVQTIATEKIECSQRTFNL